MIFCAISLLIAILASLTFTMMFPAIAVMTVTDPPATNPRFSKCFFTSGVPPTLLIMFSTPISASVNGIFLPPLFNSADQRQRTEF